MEQIILFYVWTFLCFFPLSKWLCNKASNNHSHFAFETLMNCEMVMVSLKIL